MVFAVFLTIIGRMKLLLCISLLFAPKIRSESDAIKQHKAEIASQQQVEEALRAANNRTATSQLVNISHTSHRHCPNLRHLVDISLSGHGFKVVPLSFAASFYIHIRPLAANLINRTLDTVLQARLIGTTILAADIVPSTKQPGTFRVSYTLRDPGEYRLQLRMLWLTGAGVDYTPSPRYTRDFLQSSIYIDCVFYNETIVIAGNNVYDPEIHSTHLPLCTAANLPGRWVQVTGACPAWACVGSAAAVAGLTDLFAFNEGYVWSPWLCNYQIFTPRAFEQCAVRQQIGSIRVLGDSLAREHYQNLIVFLSTPGDAANRTGSSTSTMVLPKLFTTGSFPLQLEGGHAINVTYDHFSSAMRLQRTVAVPIAPASAVSAATAAATTATAAATEAPSNATTINNNTTHSTADNMSFANTTATANASSVPATPVPTATSATTSTSRRTVLTKDISKFIHIIISSNIIVKSSKNF